MKTTSFAFVALALSLLGAATHCGGTVSLDDRPCPCADGATCCAETNRCVSSGTACGGLGSGSDGGSPAPITGCPQFQVGKDLAGVDFGVGASIRGDFDAFAQAVADLGASTASEITEITTGCKGIAVDLGAPSADQEAANAKEGADGMDSWCKLAANRLRATFGTSGTLAAAGSLVLSFVTSTCSSSVFLWSSCEAKCTPGECDSAANPPRCTGGALVSLCAGECSGNGGESVACQGSCLGSCHGSCHAQNGVPVDCIGACSATCNPKSGVGNGTGLQEDGSCEGTCSGTCTGSGTSSAVVCSGFCAGTCDAPCKGSPSNPSECDGTCSAPYLGLACSGGSLQGGCGDAVCKASCTITADAKATCTTATASVTSANGAHLTGALKTQHDAAIQSLEKNLPLILGFKPHADRFADATSALTDGASILIEPAVGNNGAACAAVIRNTIQAVVAEVTDSVAAVTTVTDALEP